MELEQINFNQILVPRFSYDKNRWIESKDVLEKICETKFNLIEEEEDDDADDAFALEQSLEFFDKKSKSSIRIKLKQGKNKMALPYEYSYSYIALGHVQGEILPIITVKFFPANYECYCHIKLVKDNQTFFGKAKTTNSDYQYDYLVTFKHALEDIGIVVSKKETDIIKIMQSIAQYLQHKSVLIIKV